MIIAVIGYKLGRKHLSVNYDTMNKKYFVCSEDGFFGYVKSKKQVRDIIKDFKKSHNNWKERSIFSNQRLKPLDCWV